MPKNLSNIKTIAEIQLAELAKATEGKSFLVPHFTRIYTLIRDLASDGTIVLEAGQAETAKPLSPPKAVPPKPQG